jgi:iron(III) transport system ATP-binding protein
MLLLDEPLANLDAHSRARMLSEIGAFRDVSGATLIYVTHDQAEALSVADRVAMMEGGRVRQVAPPLALYRTPEHADVGRFIGMGAVLRGDVTGTGPNGYATVALLGGRWRVRAHGEQRTGPAEVCVRPEDLRIGGDGETFGATVTRVMYQGGRTIVEATPLADPDVALTLSLAPEAAHAPGSTIRLAIVDGWVIPKR